MAGSNPPRDRDPDDWFAEPEPRPSRRTERPPLRPREDETRTVEHERPGSVDDWLSSGDAAPSRWPRFGAADFPSPRAAAVVGAIVLVLLVIGLAVGGAFSGGSARRATTTAPSTVPQQTTPTGSTQPTPAPVQAPALKPGDHRPQVKALQRTLAILGYSPGSTDGQYGASTQKALAQFQKAAGGSQGDSVLGI